MLWFLIRRLTWMVITLLVVFTLSWGLMRTVPGGPYQTDRKLAPEIERNIKARYDLDKPLWFQFRKELLNFLRGDFGFSYKSDYRVGDYIRQGLPISAALGLLALVFAVTLGLTAGIVSAVRRQSVLDVSLMSLATVGIALPNFVVAGLAILLFVFVWPIFPAGGWGRVEQLILPAFCLGAPYAAYIARLTRTGMLEVLGQDYIRTAYAKGLATPTVIFRHALKGAMLPVVSYLGPAIAGILTGSLVVETIFAIPGLGVHFVHAAGQRDYSLAMGLVMLYTALLYSLNMIVDIAYTLLDPRVKLQ